VRRTLDRFGGIQDVWFVPQDPRSADAAILASRPIAEVAPRSPLTLAIRRFVGEAVVPVPEAARSEKARGRGIRRRPVAVDAPEAARVGAPAR
jgi:Flp pilus assembly CpaE family ATPase